MTITQNTISRLDTLEIRIIHQDSLIDDLSEISIKQWSEIKTLTDQLNRLQNKLQELEIGIKKPPSEETRPPHF